MPRHPAFTPRVPERIIQDPVEEAKADLAAKLVRFLGTAHSVEEYVSPSGYRFKKITHRKVEEKAA